jgi:acetylornithine deacetylase
MSVDEILATLIAFNSVAGRSNRDIAGWIGERMVEAGAQVEVVEGPEGDRVNLLASFGPRDIPGLMLSGHMDVVPAEEPDWTSDPFRLTRRGDRLYGRGTSDMKGFLACMIAAAPDFAAAAVAANRPVHLAFSYDEELGCRGVPSLIAALPSLCALPLGAVIGEPSGLTPIRGHKGKAAIGIEITGRSGHSSRPDLGLNAIHAMGEILSAVTATEMALREGPWHEDFAPAWSSLQAGVVSGGKSVNIIPDHCRLEVEARAIPGVDPTVVLQAILKPVEALRARGFGVEILSRSAYPGLTTSADMPIVALVEAASGHTALAAISYGTEAGLFSAAGIPSVICGPGDIARAHRPDEYITVDELQAGLAFLRTLAARLP